MDILTDNIYMGAQLSRRNATQEGSCKADVSVKEAPSSVRKPFLQLHTELRSSRVCQSRVAVEITRHIDLEVKLSRKSALSRSWDVCMPLRALEPPLVPPGPLGSPRWAGKEPGKAKAGDGNEEVLGVGLVAQDRLIRND